MLPNNFSHARHWRPIKQFFHDNFISQFRDVHIKKRNLPRNNSLFSWYKATVSSYALCDIRLQMWHVQAIKKETSGRFENALLVVVQSVCYPARHFAQVRLCHLL